MGYDMPAQSSVIVVEGLTDVLRLHRLGYENVAGVMTSRLSEEQIVKLKSLGRDIYLMLDWDLAGYQGRKSAIEMLFDKVFIFNVPGITVCKDCGCMWPKVSRNNEGRTALHCSSCNAIWFVDKDKKDPDGLTDEQILECLKNAERVRKIS
jgi:hypothetical protein